MSGHVRSHAFFSYNFLQGDISYTCICFLTYISYTGNRAMWMITLFSASQDASIDGPWQSGQDHNRQQTKDLDLSEQTNKFSMRLDQRKMMAFDLLLQLLLFKSYSRKTI